MGEEEPIDNDENDFVDIKLTDKPESKKSEEGENLCRGDDSIPCGTSSVRICEVQKCDGTKNCPNGEDEENCPSGSDEGSGEDLPEEVEIETSEETTKPSPILPGIIFVLYEFCKYFL